MDYNYKIALATCTDVPHLFKNEQKLVPYLQENGVEVDTPIWNSRSVDWSQYDAIFIRSTWDYHTQVRAFTQWLLQLEVERLTVFNPIDILMKNMHKFYLKDLERKGYDIVPTEFVMVHENFNFDTVFQTFNTDKIIIKPARSAGAYLTTLWEKSQLVEAKEEFLNLNKTHDLLIQPFQENILEEGEWSLMYCNNCFSHAVIKTSKEGDFRVQEEFGGEYQVVTPPEWVIEQGRKIVEAFAHQNLPYARVDGIISEDKFLLMELELIEPEMFLFNEEHVATFGDAILQNMAIVKG